MKLHPLFTLLSLPLAACTTAAPTAPRTAAQVTREPPIETRAAQVLCLERLDVEETYNVVRTMVDGRSDVVIDRATNCFVIVGGADLPRLEEVIARLEDRGRYRHRPQPRPAELPVARVD